MPKEVNGLDNNQDVNTAEDKYIQDWRNSRKPEIVDGADVLTKEDFVELMSGYVIDWINKFSMPIAAQGEDNEALIKEALGRYFYEFKSTYQTKIKLDAKISKDNEEIRKNNEERNDEFKIRESSRDGLVEIYYDKFNEEKLIDHTFDDENLPKDVSSIPYAEFEKMLLGMYDNGKFVGVYTGDENFHYDERKYLNKKCNDIATCLTNKLFNKKEEVEIFKKSLPKEPEEKKAKEDKVDVKQQYADELKDFENIKKALKDCDKWNRGSSKQFKEIQNEVNELIKFIKKTQDANEEDHIVNRSYICAMREVLQVKMNRYVAARNKNHDALEADPYKKKRVQTMQALAENMDKRKLDGDVGYDDRVREMLNARLEKVTYESKLYDPRYNYEKGDTECEVLEALNEVFHGKIIGKAHAERMHDELNYYLKKFDKAVEKAIETGDNDFINGVSVDINSYIKNKNKLSTEDRELILVNGDTREYVSGQFKKDALLAKHMKNILEARVLERDRKMGELNNQILNM